MNMNYSKQTSNVHKLLPAVAALALAGATSLCSGSGTITIGTFDTSDLTAWKGLDTSAIQWVGTQDAGGTSPKGALQVHMTVTSPTSWEPAQTQFDLNSLAFNSSNYWSVSFDVKVDPASCPGNDTAYGYVAVVPLGNTWQWLDKICWIPTTPAFTGWQHIEATFQQPYANLDALVFQINNSSFNSDVIFYLDNVKVNPIPFNVVVDQFTNAAEAGTWVYQNWSQPGTSSWVAGPDAGGPTPPGHCDWTATSPNRLAMEEQSVFQKDLHVDPNLFAKLEMDVMVDPSSYPMANGAFPQIEAILNENADYHWIFLGLQDLPTPGTWAHLTFPLAGPLAANPTVTNLNSIILRVDGGGNGNPGPTNTVRVFVDNIKFAQNSPPSLALVKNSLPAGLQIGCTAAKDWQRQGIVTPATIRNYTWVGRSQPVTYSFSITNFPDWTTNPSFEAHLWLINYDTLNNPNDETWSEVDYNATDVVYVKLKNSYAGGAQFTFNYKTDAAYSPNYTWLDELDETSALGTWSVTFMPDGTVTLTGPSGSTDEFRPRPKHRQPFLGPDELELRRHQERGRGEQWRLRDFQRHQCDGRAQPDCRDVRRADSDSFWRLALNDAAGLWFVPAGTAQWLTWNLPDSGFNSQRPGP